MCRILHIPPKRKKERHPNRMVGAASKKERDMKLKRNQSCNRLQDHQSIVCTDLVVVIAISIQLTGRGKRYCLIFSTDTGNEDDVGDIDNTIAVCVAELRRLRCRCGRSCGKLFEWWLQIVYLFVCSNGILNF